MILTEWIDLVVGKRNRAKIRSILGDHIQIRDEVRVFKKDFFKLNMHFYIDIKCDRCDSIHNRNLFEFVRKQKETYHLCNTCVYHDASQKMKETVRTQENRERKSKTVSEFYKTERGLEIKKIRGEKHKLWHKTPEGIESNKRNGSRLPVFYKENHPNWNPNKDEYSKYRSEVYRQTNKNDLTLLENHDKPRGMSGIDGAYQLDHIISIKYGFVNNIPPSVIGNINNLRFIPWKENRNKWYRVDDHEIENLLNKINNP
jgi:hypothetical protein